MLCCAVLCHALQVIEVAYGAAALEVPVGLMRLVGGSYLMAAVVVNCLKVGAHGRAPRRAGSRV